MISRETTENSLVERFGVVKESPIQVNPAAELMPKPGMASRRLQGPIMRLKEHS